MPTDLAHEHEAMMLELEAAELELEAEAEAQAGVRIADVDEEAPAEDVAEDPAPVDADASLDDLRDREDVEAILRRAKALRLGDGMARDIEASFEHYRVAAELGSPHGKFSEALFYLSGAVVAEDVTAGLGKLRAAAQAGSLRAKVYLANVYELGVGREPDFEKADVWYRSAVRAAKIEIDPDEDEAGFTLAMADLGSIRHARVVLKDDSIPKKERYAYLTKAKALGFALHQRNKQRASMEQEEIQREIEEAMKAPPPEEEGAEGDAAADEADAKKADAKKKREKPEPESGPQIGPSKPKMGERFTAFVIAMFFVGLGIGAGVMGTVAAKELIAAGEAVPVFGMHWGYILPTTVSMSMVLVALVYQWRTILASMVGAGALGAAGWTLWKNPAGSLFADRLTQAHVFGVVGLVVALLVLGLLGGTRQRRWSK